MAEEAIGLAKSVGWEVDYGLKYKDETEDVPAEVRNEWEDDHLRESIAIGSVVRVRTAQSATFLGKGQITATLEHIQNNNIGVVFVNAALTPPQLKHLDKYRYAGHGTSRVRAPCQ